MTSSSLPWVIHWKNQQCLEDPLEACSSGLIYLSTFTTTQSSDLGKEVQSLWALAFSSVQQERVQVSPWKGLAEDDDVDTKAQFTAGGPRMG